MQFLDKLQASKKKYISVLGELGDTGPEIQITMFGINIFYLDQKIAGSQPAWCSRLSYSTVSLDIIWTYVVCLFSELYMNIVPALWFSEYSTWNSKLFEYLRDMGWFPILKFLFL